MTTSDALTLLRPGASWTMRGSVIEWHDTIQVQPSQTEIDACIAAYSYRELRAQAYPPIGDQLDAFWKGGQAQADMLALVQAVKTKYPKGS